MAKPKKLPSGNYRVRVHIGNGKYKSFTAPTKLECELKANEFLMTGKADNEMSVCEVVLSYINLKKDSLSPSTIRGYKIVFRNQIVLLEGIKVKDFDQVKHQRWVDLISKSLQPKSVKNANGLLVSALNFFDVSLKDVKLPQKKYVDIKVPTTKQVNQIIDYFYQRGNIEMVKACLLASVGTLRRGEVLGLMAEDIDRENNTITIRRSKVITPEGKEVLKEPKTYSSNRTIELPIRVINLLPNTNPVVNLSLGMLTHYFNYAKNKLGFDFTFHSLRHYSASVMHSQNIPIKYIMARGGWKSEDTLKRIYQNTLDDFTKKFNKQINDYFDDEVVSYSCHILPKIAQNRDFLQSSIKYLNKPQVRYIKGFSAIKKSTPKGAKWTRRESNPRPKILYS